jgi:hypothetical protein
MELRAFFVDKANEAEYDDWAVRIAAPESSR